jgi:mannosidase alpha-like ER degradation enhancer 1
MFQVQTSVIESATEVLVTGYTALFGADLSDMYEEKGLRFVRGEGVRIVRDRTNSGGCLPYADKYDDVILLVNRRECTFLQKLVLARSAGAAGIVVISDTDIGINPSAADDELETVRELSDVAIVLLTRQAGEVVLNMLDWAESRGSGQVMVALDPERRSAMDGGDPLDERKEKSPDPNRVLYLNGHPLLNTRLLV